MLRLGLRLGVSSAALGGPAPVAPLITVQPTGGTYDGVTPVTLSVTATGTAPLTYQWYTGSSGDTGSPVGGATNSTYDASPVADTSYWVRVTNAAGSADSTAAVVVALQAAFTRLVTSASIVIDFTRAGTLGPYTTAAGTTPSADGGTLKAVVPEKISDETATRWTEHAGTDPVWEHDGTNDIDGAGVIKFDDTLGLDNCMLGGNDGIFPAGVPGNYLSTTKWWVVIKGRTPTGVGATFGVMFRSDSTNERLTVSYQALTGTLRLSVHNGTSATNYDVAVATGTVFVIGAYFDGTNLHRWMNTTTRADNASTGTLGSLAGVGCNVKCQNATPVWMMSCIWAGKLDGSDATQHTADIQTLITDKLT